MTSTQTENSLCCLAANVFDRSSEERNQNLWYFSPLSAERASAEGKACLCNSISCSELHFHNQASFVLFFTSWSWCSWDHVLVSLVCYMGASCGTASSMRCDGVWETLSSTT